MDFHMSHSSMCIQHNETDILGIHWEYIFILFSYNLNISQGLSFKKQIRFHLFSDSLKQYCLSDITIGLLMTPRAFEWVYVSFEWCLLLLFIPVLIHWIHWETTGWTVIILEYGSDGTISLLKAHAWLTLHLPGSPRPNPALPVASFFWCLPHSILLPEFLTEVYGWNPVDLWTWMGKSQHLHC